MNRGSAATAASSASRAKCAQLVPDERSARLARQRRMHHRQLAPRKERRHLGGGVDWWIRLVGAEGGVRKGRGQRITQHNGLPTQVRQRGIERFGEVAAAGVSRKQNVGSNGGVEIRLVDVSGRAGDAGANQIRNQRLRRAGKWFG
jgi:hypothetical protein